MTERFITKLSLIFIVIMAIMPSKVFSQGITGNSALNFTFIPDWQDGMELVYYNQVTNLNTNERDMVMYMTVDSLYTVMNISLTDSQTWILHIENFSKYDKISKTAYLRSQEVMKNAPYIIEFDSSYNFLRMVNWTQWRDTLNKNLNGELQNRVIDKKTYDEYFELYKKPKEVEKVVLNYYPSMFSILGRQVKLWYEFGVEDEIKNPFKQNKKLSKTGIESFYYRSETPSLINRRYEIKSDSSDAADLSQDYLDYMLSISPSNSDIPPPNVGLTFSEFHEFDSKRKNIKEFRNETAVRINGAGTFLENRLILLNIRY